MEKSFPKMIRGSLTAEVEVNKVRDKEKQIRQRMFFVVTNVLGAMEKETEEHIQYIGGMQALYGEDFADRLGRPYDPKKPTTLERPRQARVIYTELSNDYKGHRHYFSSAKVAELVTEVLFLRVYHKGAQFQSTVLAEVQSERVHAFLRDHIPEFTGHMSNLSADEVQVMVHHLEGIATGKGTFIPLDATYNFSDDFKKAWNRLYMDKALGARIAKGVAEEVTPSVKKQLVSIRERNEKWRAASCHHQ